MNKKYEKIKIMMKIIILITLFNFLIKLSLKVQIIIKQINEFKNELVKIEKYKEINDKGILLNKIKFKKIQKPKISIISAAYNRGKYILRFLRSINFSMI